MSKGLVSVYANGNRDKCPVFACFCIVFKNRMPQICKPCIHPRREDLNTELARVWRRSLRAIGAEYGLSKDALARHARRHLPQDFVETVRKTEWEAARSRWAKIEGRAG